MVSTATWWLDEILVPNLASDLRHCPVSLLVQDKALPHVTRVGRQLLAEDIDATDWDLMHRCIQIHQRLSRSSLTP